MSDYTQHARAKVKVRVKLRRKIAKQPIRRSQASLFTGCSSGSTYAAVTDLHILLMAKTITNNVYGNRK